MKPPTADDLEALIRAAIDAGDSTLINFYGSELDAWERAHPKTPPPLAGAALWYAEQGLRVFPLRPADKRPYSGTHGSKDGTTDQDRIRSWWSARPHSNVAICTGHLVDVIDVDGLPGVKEWAERLAKPGGLGEIVGMVSTPRAGGTHLYGRATGRGNGHEGALDYRGKGGYVVAPPSANSAGIRYRWLRPLDLTGVTERT